MRRGWGWSSPWATAAVTAVATAAIGVPVRRALIRWGTMDVPNHRSSHTAPTPRGGGIAALLGAGTAALVTGRRPSVARAASVLALAGVGLADDLTGHVPARVRLGTHLTLGAGTLSHGGWDRPVAGVVTAGVVNVFNFMDGINGISGMTAVVWGVNAMLLEDESGGDLATLGALTAGAGLGFLTHNVPNARLFLGDVGSYAFGAAMAAGILSQESLAARYRVATPLLLYGVDAGQALVGRARADETLTEAHRDHVYQRLVDRGLPHVQTSLLHAGAASGITLIRHMPHRLRGLATAAIVACYLSAPRCKKPGGPHGSLTQGPP